MQQAQRTGDCIVDIANDVEMSSSGLDRYKSAKSGSGVHKKIMNCPLHYFSKWRDDYYYDAYFTKVHGVLIMENRVLNMLKDYDVAFHGKFSFFDIQYCGLFGGTTKWDLGKWELYMLYQENSFIDGFFYPFIGMYIPCSFMKINKLSIEELVGGIQAILVKVCTVCAHYCHLLQHNYTKQQWIDKEITQILCKESVSVSIDICP